MRKKTKIEFVEKAQAKHGDRYDYSQTEYKGNCIPVKIVCPEHGEFWQRPAEHYKHLGCKGCSSDKKKQRRLGTKKFIEAANKIHMGRYDYSKVVYKSAWEKVEIVCSIHGSFYQKPSHHTQGSNCPACAQASRNKKICKDTKHFLGKAKIIHGNSYSYSKTNYTSAKTNVEIICPRHGSFYQMPNVHLRGSGCPSCSKTGFDGGKPGTLYYLRIIDPYGKSWFKIGITNKKLSERYSKDFINEVDVLLERRYKRGYVAAKIESRIKRKFCDVRIRPPSNLLKGHEGYSEIYPINILNL